MTTTKASNCRRDAAQKKAAALRAEQQRTERRRTLLVRASLIGGGVLAVSGLVTLGALTGKSPTATASSSKAPSLGSVTTAAATAGESVPPWQLPTDSVAAIKAAGITPAAEEGAVEHYHAHLDILVNGKRVPVTAGIGIAQVQNLISPLHTHEGDGVVHVEAPTKGTPYYLGQLFREWNVALSDTRIGGLRVEGGRALTAYVNGKPVAGNPAAIRLAGHQEIALVFGATDAKVAVPATYDFKDL